MPDVSFAVVRLNRLVIGTNTLLEPLPRKTPGAYATYLQAKIQA